jgi:hypothetical protein
VAYSIGKDDALVSGGTQACERLRRWPGSTRRGIQVALGALWLLGTALQLQPFMFTADFARQVLARSGQDHPVWVSAPTDFFVRLIAGHPAPLNVGFALVQLALGVGFLVPRLVRPAIVGYVAWAAGTWWFGEGLGGLAIGIACVVTGAPGAVLLYGVLALAVWLATDARRPRDADDGAIAGWFPFAWLILCFGGGLLQLLPSQRGAAARHDQLGSAEATPAWLTSLSSPRRDRPGPRRKRPVHRTDRSDGPDRGRRAGRATLAGSGQRPPWLGLSWPPLSGCWVRTSVSFTRARPPFPTPAGLSS